MKIGIVSYSLFPDNAFNPGIENFGWNLARELSKSNQVHVFESGSHDSDVASSELLTHRSSPISTFGGFALNQFSFARQLVQDNRKILNDLDIIHDVGSFIPFFSKKLDPPVLTTFQHHAAPSSLRDYVQGFPVPLIFQKEPFADRVIAASEFSAKQVREEYGCQDVTVIPNGVDTSMYTPSEEPRIPSESEVTLLFVGPLTERKNIRPLLISTHLLTKQLNRKIELRIAGKGPQENQLRRYVDELGINSTVTFLGHVSDDSKLAAEYQSADCFVFPSLLEGFGMVVVEALACGTPVAASNIEPLLSIVDNAGDFFDPSDPEAIAATVAGILKDRQRYSSLCSAAIDRGQRFSWGRIANEYMEVYEEMSRPS